MSGETFLSRWSRRKQEAAEAENLRQTSPEPPAPIPAEPEGPEGEPPLSPEDIAALPSLDSLTAETDITAFLRKGVPEILRNAALRRAWALDPKVRDFVCEAREYAYDWNVPGGVPGAGPLLASDDPQAMMERMFSELRPAEDDADRPAPAAEAPAEPSPERAEVARAAESGADAPQNPPLQASITIAPPPLAPEPPAEARIAAAGPEIARVRRHGGAMPD